MLIISICFLIGCLAGTSSGLLGVGGGIIIIPGLLWLFELQHFPQQYLMQMAAGTSLAIIVLGSSSAMFAHRSRLADVFPIYLQLMPGLILGALIGALIASRLDSHILMILFAILVYAMALKMWFDKTHKAKKMKMPKRPVMISFGTLVGLKSGLLGIGGGIISVPFFTHIGTGVRKAMILSAQVSATVALFGAASFVYHGWHLSGLPDKTWGFVYWPALIGTAFGSLLFAPFGVWLNRLMPGKILRKVFAVFLVIVGTRMIF